MLHDVRAPRAVRRAAVVAEVLIRLCRAEDLPQLEWFGMYSHHREIFEDTFARHLRGENLMLVADLNNFPVGQAWLDLMKRRGERVGYIWAVRVFPLLRNVGIGTLLMSCFLAGRQHCTAQLRGWRGPWMPRGMDMRPPMAKRLASAGLRGLGSAHCAARRCSGEPWWNI